MTEYWLYVGSTPGGFDIFDSGTLGDATLAQVDNIPTDGRDIFVTLWFRDGTRSWQSASYDFIASGTPPSVVTPTAQISGETQNIYLDR